MKTLQSCMLFTDGRPSTRYLVALVSKSENPKILEFRLYILESTSSSNAMKSRLIVREWSSTRTTDCQMPGRAAFEERGKGSAMSKHLKTTHNADIFYRGNGGPQKECVNKELGQFYRDHVKRHEDLDTKKEHVTPFTKTIVKPKRDTADKGLPVVR